MAVALADGQVPPVWAPDLGNGHGQPLFQFAPPLLYLVALPLRLLGAGLTDALQLALAGLFIARRGQRLPDRPAPRLRARAVLGRGGAVAVRALPGARPLRARRVRGGRRAGVRAAGAPGPAGRGRPTDALARVAGAGVGDRAPAPGPRSRGAAPRCRRWRSPPAPTRSPRRRAAASAPPRPRLLRSRSACCSPLSSGCRRFWRANSCSSVAPGEISPGRTTR